MSVLEFSVSIQNQKSSGSSDSDKCWYYLAFISFSSSNFSPPILFNEDWIVLKYEVIYVHIWKCTIGFLNYFLHIIIVFLVGSSYWNLYFGVPSISRLCGKIAEQIAVESITSLVIFVNIIRKKILLKKKSECMYSK